MKRILTALILAPLAVASWAAGSDAALRAECAAKNQPKTMAKPAANEYQFVYHKGEYRGEVQAGKQLACSESQYSAYLASVDPARAMAANPTAAGKPNIKPDIKPHLDQQIKKEAAGK